MKNYLIFLFVIAFVLLFSVDLMASQPGFQQPGIPCDFGCEPVPIDGGLGLLAAAGGAYAWKKLRNKQV